MEGGPDDGGGMRGVGNLPAAAKATGGIPGGRTGGMIPGIEGTPLDAVMFPALNAAVVASIKL